MLTGCSQPQPPNIVLIYIDDLGWRDLGFMGSTYYETPHIDELAASGMTFTDAYANAPNCAPSRAALLSGQYAPRHGVYTVASSERGESRFRKLVPTVNTTSLDTSTVLIAEALQRAGYHTAHFGKWHLGNNEHAPENQGFIVADEASWKTKRSHFMPDTGEYMADYLTDRAVDYLKEQGEKPFFLYLSHYGVHTPIESKQDKIDKFSQKEGDDHHFDPTYAGMIESIDESVGRVLATLEEEGLAENTMVLFFADNGGYGPITKMHPLRGAKGMLYEGGIREPLVVRWPGKVQAGSSSDTPVIGIDLYPTFLDAAGVGASPSYTLDGVSLTPLLTGTGSLDREAIYWHFPAYLEAYRDSEVPWRTTPVAAVRSGEYKLIEFFGEGQLELYNLDADIGERNNLAEDMPEKVDELYAMMQAWRQNVNAPVPTTLNPEFDAETYRAANALHNPYR
ncbi:MAG: sulfatase [Rhodothermaceae bacterium]|nr:sulfatase [Rhodothermaceae bacterium]